MSFLIFEKNTFNIKNDNRVGGLKYSYQSPIKFNKSIPFISVSYSDSSDICFICILLYLSVYKNRVQSTFLMPAPQEIF